ncbi:cyclin-domain-containing protein [Scleroderma yunnanense]
MDSSGRVALPSAFEDADIDNLAVLIADMLERLMAHNDQIPLLPQSLTRFHSRAIPSISVLDYLRRIIKFTKVETTCLLLTLHYVDQICARTPLFTLSSLTCHRFIIASITVCSKGLCDTFCTNSLYARVGGIPVSELNVLEREFLRMIDWRLTCTREVLQEYYINLVRTDSSKQFYIKGMHTAPPPVAHASSTTEDSDMESMETSQSPSPNTSPVAPHVVAPVSVTALPHTHTTLPLVPSHVPVSAAAPSAPIPMSGLLRPQRPPALPREASTILIDTATLTPQAPQGPTVEQNMAFADLQKSWGEQASDAMGRIT